MTARSMLRNHPEASVLDTIRQHLLEEPRGGGGGEAAEASFGSLVADMWSDSLPFRDDDADDMVVFGAMRDAFSCGWLPDGVFAEVKPEPLLSPDSSSYDGSSCCFGFADVSEPVTPSDAASGAAASMSMPLVPPPSQLNWPVQAWYPAAAPVEQVAITPRVEQLVI